MLPNSQGGYTSSRVQVVELVIGIVTTMCPTTGRHARTGVEMDRLTFNALRLNRHHTFHCWLCGHKHDWSRRWATLV